MASVVVSVIKSVNISLSIQAVAYLRRVCTVDEYPVGQRLSLPPPRRDDLSRDVLCPPGVRDGPQRNSGNRPKKKYFVLHFY